MLGGSVGNMRKMRDLVMPCPIRPWKPVIAALLLLVLASDQAAADGPKHGLSAFGGLR